MAASGSVARSTEQRIERRDELVACALALLRRDGPGALTMRNVADEAGVTATALYRHFASKEALLAEIVRAAYAVFRQSLMGQVPTGDPEVWLRLAFDRFLRFALEHPNYYRLLFVEPHGIGIDRYPDDFRAGRSSGFRQLRDLVAASMRAGVIAGQSSRDAADVALTIYAHMHGLITLFLAGRFPDARVFQRFYLESLDRLLSGLR
jgi:AcrR family transcriptional regulator